MATTPVIPVDGSSTFHSTPSTVFRLQTPCTPSPVSNASPSILKDSPFSITSPAPQTPGSKKAAECLHVESSPLDAVVQNLWSIWTPLTPSLDHHDAFTSPSNHKHLNMNHNGKIMSSPKHVHRNRDIFTPPGDPWPTPKRLAIRRSPASDSANLPPTRSSSLSRSGSISTTRTITSRPALRVEIPVFPLDTDCSPRSVSEARFRRLTGTHTNFGSHRDGADLFLSPYISEPLSLTPPSFRVVRHGPPSRTPSNDLVEAGSMILEPATIRARSGTPSSRSPTKGLKRILDRVRSVKHRRERSKPLSSTPITP